jgi:hypothetical protein
LEATVNDWVTNKDALFTLIELDGLKPGDEVMIKGDGAGAEHWDDSKLRLTENNEAVVLEAPNGSSKIIVGKSYNWVSKDFAHRIVIAWRRP